MLNTSLRRKRSGPASAMPMPLESEFHQTRMQEQMRTHVMKDFGANEQQVTPAYFTKSLQELSAQRLADSFAECEEVDALREEQPELYAMVLERLPVEPDSMPPLRITVPRIIDEKYWQRCCKARWSLGQLSRMTKGQQLREKEYGWKRLFLEQVLNDFLMGLGSGSAAESGDGSLLPPGGVPVVYGVPPVSQKRVLPQASAAVTCTPYDADASRFDLSLDKEAIAALRELCAICRDYVHTVDLPCQLVHFCFYEHLFAYLPGIRSFRLTFGVANRGVRVGVTDMIGFRDEDAERVHQLLRHYSSLESLRLPLNRLADRHVQLISAGLMNSTGLRVLDFSQNSLTDAAIVEAVSLLLCRPDFPLEELYLADNQLADAAAAALAETLRYNKTLRILHLQQNRIGDAAGGALLMRALAIHPTLANVNLGSNRLGPSTAMALSEVLPQLTQLRVLHLSGNPRLVGDSVVQHGVSSSPPSTDGDATAATTAGSTDSSISHSSRPSVQQCAVLAEDSDAEASGSDGAHQTEAVDEQGNGEADASLTPSRMAQGEAYMATATARPSMTTIPGEDVPAPLHGGPPLQEKHGGTSETLPAAAQHAPLVQTTGGMMIAAAVQANTSLVELDVRFCGLTAAEEQAIMHEVQERVYRHRIDTSVASQEAKQRSVLLRRAAERVALMTGQCIYME
ncbi:hypothetical protein JKF63_05479 [Porcisia hertigi]|uniref:Uncharacterized protein n=1 Tax=Porcisia hertigi TaxID=2761500 RepID=A0A836LIN7_9TRYP|nr:hypothetical protein JKF63_05479 [Porcisia hertigi]